MGITGLNQFLKKFDIYNEITLGDLSYKIIVFDIASHIYQYMSVYGKERNKWMGGIINLICVFKQHNIHLIPVFDGVAPVEKTEEREDRRQQRDKNDEKCMTISVALEKYKLTNIPEPILYETMKSIIKKQEASSSKSFLHSKKEVSDEEPTINIEAIEAFITNKERSIFNITDDDIKMIKEFLTVMKIPFIQAPKEAEGLCCYLAKTGRAYAVFSLDSDCIAHRAPIIINKLNMSTGVCSVIQTSNVMTELELETEEELLTFLIICGTDYNRQTKNIKGVGPVNALKMVKKWKTYEAIRSNEKSFKDIEDDGLRYEKNVELFNEKYTQFDKISLYWEVRDVNFDDVKKFISTNDVPGDINRIEKLWRVKQIIYEEED